MNRFTLSIFLASLLAVPVAQAADEEDHAAHHPGDGQSQAAPVQDNKAAEMPMEKMQEKMKKMREQMEKIHADKDPVERQKLMKEHMQSMQEGMKMMRGMGAEMMGKKKKGEPMMEDGGDAGDMQMGMMMKHHKMMEDRLEMMQMMMEQMMEHDSAEQKMERGR